MPDIIVPKRTDQLDATERHDRRIGWFVAEASRQASTRAVMAKCERYYDSEQHDPQEAQDIRERGQNPVTINEIAPSIDWLIGTERRTRVDFKVQPRESLDPDSTKDAENKTKLLKWLDDTNGGGFERSNAWDDAVKAGLGWIEVGVRGDLSDEPIYKRSESWRAMLHDSMGTRKDTRDWRYTFRLKMVDLDIALAYFPSKEKELLKVRQRGNDLQTFSTWWMGAGNLMDLGLLEAASALDQNAMPLDLFNPRDRVLLVECWNYDPFTVKQRPNSSLYDRVQLRMRMSIMTEFDTLIEDWSPYKHNRFHFIPLWGYRNKTTGMPYSPIKRMLDKQDAVNHAYTKALFEISVNQIIMEADAIDNEAMTIEEVQEEISDPAGVAVLAKGALTNKKFQTRRGIENAQAQLQLADRMITAMQGESSVTGENRGLDTNAISGKAIGLKQDQGGVLSAELFDNALLARKQEGEIELSLVEQYLVKPMAVPIAGERGQYEMLELNQMLDDGTVLNDITARSARFVVDEQPWRATLGQAMFESLIELMGKLAPVAPQVVTAILDLVFEYADMPNKQSMLQRIRAVTGQPGPDNEMTPEQKQAQDQANAVKEAQFRAQMAKLAADIHEASARGDKLDAESVAKRLEALYMAAQGAQVIAMNPTIAPMVDELAKSAGFQDQNAAPIAPEPGAVQPGAAIPPAQQADGALVGHETGIRTPGADGVINPQE
jgi:hypothetical protein